MGGDATAIWLAKGGNKITFDIKIKTPKGALFCAYIKRKEVATTAKNNGKQMSVRLAHDVSGHTAKENSKTTMMYLGYKVAQEEMQPCSACAEAKARQKNLPTRVLSQQVVRMKVPIPSEVNGKVNLDISTIKTPKGVHVTVTKPQWRIITDQHTQMKFSNFYPKKSDKVEQTCELFQRWKQKGYPVRIVRCDNAGENISLEKKKLQCDMAIKFRL